MNKRSNNDGSKNSPLLPPSIRPDNTPSWLYPGAWVWVPHPSDAWQRARVLSISRKSVIVATDDEDHERDLPLNYILPLDPSLIGVSIDDLTRVSRMHEASLLYVLKQRLISRNCYTRIGDKVLLSLNPYGNSRILSNEVMRFYIKEGVMQRLIHTASAKAYTVTTDITYEPHYQDDTAYFSPLAGHHSCYHSVLNKLSAHPFAIIEAALTEITCDSEDQSIVLMGDQGSGKTFLLRNFIQYFIERAEMNPKNSKQHTLLSRIQQAIGLLETFGNASIGKHHDSSRFGKVVDLIISVKRNTSIQKNILLSSIQHCNIYNLLEYEPSVVGAQFTTLLHDVTLLTRLPHDCKNFRIFYQLISGLSPVECDMLFIKDNSIFAMLPSNDIHSPLQSSINMDQKSINHRHYALTEGYYYGGPSMPHGDLGDGLALTKMALTNMEVSLDDQLGIFKILAAILHLSNLEFIEQLGIGAEIEIPGPASIIETLLGLTKGELNIMICTKSQTKASGRERNMDLESDVNVDERVPVTVTDAKLSRDRLMIGLYDRVHDFILQKINSCLKFQPKEAEDTFQMKSPSSILSSSPSSLYLKNNNLLEESCHILKIIDMPGFESLQSNHLFQLCYNYCDEIIHKYFNMTIFNEEQSIYTRERIDVPIKYHNNSKVINEIDDNRQGLFIYLEQCHNRGVQSDDAIESLLERAHGNKTSADGLLKLKNGGSYSTEEPLEFIISHTFHDVEYSCLNMVNDNYDHVVSPAMMYLVHCTSTFFIKKLCPKDYMQKRLLLNLTNTKVIKDSLDNLIKLLNHTRSSFIKCVRPNESGNNKTMDSFLILKQLKCMGVGDLMRLHEKGYTEHYSFDQFIKFYGMLNPSGVPILWTLSQPPPDNLIVILPSLQGPEPKNKINNNDKDKLSLMERLRIQRDCCRLLLERIANDPTGYRVGDTKILLSIQLRIILDSRRLSVLNASSAKIQALFRAFYHTRVFKELKDATMFCQKFYRWSNARRSSLKLVRRFQSVAWIIVEQQRAKRHVAAMLVYQSATRIQTCYRRYYCQHLYNQMRCQSIRIQSFWRCQRVRLSYLILRQASIQLSCIIRGYFLRKTLVISHMAAYVIQRAWRRYALKQWWLRCKSVAGQLNKFRRDRQFQRKELIFSKVAVSLRQYIYASVRLKQRNAASVIYRGITKWRILYHLRKLCRSVARAQAIGRGYLVRHIIKTLHLYASRIKATWRGYRTRLYLVALNVAVSQIQSAWRRYRTYRLYITIRRSVVILQRNVRKYLLQRQLKLTRKVTYALRPLIRAFLARCCYKKIIRSMKYLIKWWRIRNNVRKIRKMDLSACVIQRAWRCKMEWEKLKTMPHKYKEEMSKARGRQRSSATFRHQIKQNLMAEYGSYVLDPERVDEFDPFLRLLDKHANQSNNTNENNNNMNDMNNMNGINIMNNNESNNKNNINNHSHGRGSAEGSSRQKLETEASDDDDMSVSDDASPDIDNDRPCLTSHPSNVAKDRIKKRQEKWLAMAEARGGEVLRALGVSITSDMFDTSNVKTILLNHNKLENIGCVPLSISLTAEELMDRVTARSKLEADDDGEDDSALIKTTLPSNYHSNYYNNQSNMNSTSMNSLAEPVAQPIRSNPRSVSFKSPSTTRVPRRIANASVNNNNMDNTNNTSDIATSATTTTIATATDSGVGEDGRQKEGDAVVGTPQKYVVPLLYQSSSRVSTLYSNLSERGLSGVPHYASPTNNSGSVVGGYGAGLFTERLPVIDTKEQRQKYYTKSIVKK